MHNYRGYQIRRGNFKFGKWSVTTPEMKTYYFGVRRGAFGWLRASTIGGI